MPSPHLIDRRSFAFRLASGVGGVAAAMTPLPPTATAEDKPAGENSSEKRAHGDTKQEKDKNGSPPDPPAEVMLLTYLVRQYPSDRYDETTLHGIFRDIRGDVARSRQLSSTSLKNGDEPSFIFKAFHGGLPIGETDGKK